MPLPLRGDFTYQLLSPLFGPFGPRFRFLPPLLPSTNSSSSLPQSLLPPKPMSISIASLSKFSSMDFLLFSFSNSSADVSEGLLPSASLATLASVAVDQSFALKVLM